MNERTNEVSDLQRIEEAIQAMTTPPLNILIARQLAEQKPYLTARVVRHVRQRHRVDHPDYSRFVAKDLKDMSNEAMRTLFAPPPEAQPAPRPRPQRDPPATPEEREQLFRQFRQTYSQA